MIRQVTAVMREVEPDILLLPSPEDYMEDHMNTCPDRGDRRVLPRHAELRHSSRPASTVQGEVALYHALPYGLWTGCDGPSSPDFFVDISSVIEPRRRCWLPRVPEKVARREPGPRTAT